MAAGPSAIFLLLLLLFIVAALSAIILFVRQKSARRVEHSQCGKCSYRVEGLETLRCPECGSDLREVGIVTPATSGRVSPVVWAILWTIILPLPAFFLYIIVASLLPAFYMNSRVVDLNQSRADAGYSQVRMTLESETAASPNSYNKGRLALLLSSKQYGTEFMFDPAAVESQTDRTPEAVAQWIADETGMSAPDDLMVAEANELLEHIDNAIRNSSITTTDTSSFRGGSMSSSVRDVSKRWYQIGGFILWAVVWIFGIVVIFRRSRRSGSKDAQAKSRIIDVAAK